MKTPLYKILIIHAFMLVFSFQAFPVYIMGGEITYTQSGKDSFVITLTVYRDCNSAALPNPVIYVKCASTGATLTTLYYSNVVSQDITPSCSTSCNPCNNPSCSNPYGVQKLTFQKLLILTNAGSCCKLNLSYSQCCRSLNLTTGPANTNFFIESRFNRCVDTGNNFPELHPPVMFLSSNNQYQFNGGVKDTNIHFEGEVRDSFSYYLIIPRTSESTNVSYQGNYYLDKPLYFDGFPNPYLSFPKGFNVDNLTGEISFTPKKIEKSILVFRIEHFRVTDDTLIELGIVSREWSLFVINTASVSAAPVIAGNNTIYVCPGTTLAQNISCTDKNSSDLLSMNYSGNISGAGWSSKSGQNINPEGTFTWTPNKSHISTKPYYFTISARDNACPLNEQNSKTFKIFVTDTTLNMGFQDSIISCGAYRLMAHSTANTLFKYKWNLTDGFFNINLTGKDPVFYPPRGGLYELTLQIDNMHCIHHPLYDSILIDTSIYLEKRADTSICTGDAFIIYPKVMFNKGAVSYKWSNGDTNRILTIKPPYKSMSNLSLLVTDIDGCKSSDTFHNSINQKSTFEIPEELALCYPDTQMVRITLKDYIGLIDSILVKDLTRDSVLAVNSITFQVNQAGPYLVRTKTQFNCNYDKILTVHKNHEIRANAPSLNLCPATDTFLVADTTGDNSPDLKYFWYHLPDSSLMDTGRILNIKPYSNHRLKLLVLENYYGKTCSDQKEIKVTVKSPPPLFHLPGGFCRNDTLLNLKTFTDTSLVDLFLTGDHLLYGQYINPGKCTNDTLDINARIIHKQSLCEADTQFVLVMRNNPEIKLSNQYNKYDFCSCPRSIILYCSPVGGKYGGYWTGPVDSGKYFSLDKEAGLYNLGYHYTDNYGCSAEGNMTISIYETSLDIDKSITSVCEDEKLPVSANYNGPGYMRWYVTSASDGFFKKGIFDPDNIYQMGNKDKLRQYLIVYAKSLDTFCNLLTDSHFVKINARPSAEFFYKQNSGQAPSSVEFMDFSSIDYDSIAEYQWNFGDGSFSNLPNPVHLYQNPGYYDVTLKVSSNKGCSDSLERKDLIYVYPVSVDEQSALKITIYPNPAQDQVIIESSESLDKVIVYNFLGAKIREMDVNENKVALHRDKLPSGLYLLKVYDIKGGLYAFQVVFK